MVQVDESRSYLVGFVDFYETEIRDWMSNQTNRHAQAKRFALIVGGVGAALLPLLIWLYFKLEVGTSELAIQISIGALFLYIFGVGYLATKPLRSLSGEVKAFLLEKVCGYIGLKYDISATGFPFDRFNEIGLLPGHHRKKIEDKIYGSHDDVRFELAECRLHRIQRSGRTTSYVEVYHGVLFNFTFPKRFSGKTLVLRDSGSIGNFFKGIGKENRIRLEDPRFEKMFEVYGTDQVEARYLLTPTFMERLMELAELFGQKSVELAFEGDNLLLSIRVSEDQFEGGGMFRRMTDVSRIETLVRELCAVFDVVETLKLNLKTNI